MSGAIDAIALEAARQIDDLLVQVHNSHTQRTARIQIVVREALLRIANPWHPVETAPSGADDFFLVCGVDDERSPFVVRGDILKSARRPDTPGHLHLHYITHWKPLDAKPAKEGA